MLPTQRRQAILAELRQAKAVSAEELARRFGVSLETIRRDLRGLRDRGLLERVYGGALPVRTAEGDFATRSTLHAMSKLPEWMLRECLHDSYHGIREFAAERLGIRPAGGQPA